MAFDHAAIVAAAHERLRAKLSYTNLGFALAPRTFTISALRDLYVAALGHPVSATNLQRVLTRRGVLAPTGGVAAPGPTGGRPAALFRFTQRSLRVTDAFAVLKPPGDPARGAVP
jgi:8-oxo-dGTP diphosphatase